MAEGILGLAGGGAGALNQEVIDKLKAAESKVRIAPVEKKIEKWDDESLKMAKIKTLSLDLISSFNNLTLENSSNVFEKKSAITTGKAVTYDASDVSGLVVGTTSVSITQLAQRDVYQTGTFDKKDSLVPVIYKSGVTSDDTANDKVGAGKFTITPSSGDSITVETTDTTTWDDLVGLINDADTKNILNASIVDKKMTIKSLDGKPSFTIKDTTGTVISDLKIPNSAITTIQVSGTPVYESNKTSVTTSVDKVGAGEISITPAGGSEIKITTDDNTTWDGLKDLINANTNLKASYVNNRLEITSKDEETALTIKDNSGTVSANLGISRGRKFSIVGKTYDQLATSINANSKLTSSVEQVGDDKYRLVIKGSDSGTSNKLTIDQSGVTLGITSELKSHYVKDVDVYVKPGASDTDKITLNGKDFKIKDKSYDSLADLINDDADFNASTVSGRIVITRVDGTDVSIDHADVDLGFSSAIINAQNLKATIDGVAYDVSTNKITTQGSLKITANELGNSSITISQDTTEISTTAKTMVEKYNTFVEAIDEELNNPQSSLQDKSSLRSMRRSMKDMLFASYGEKKNQNIFNFGFSLDKSGKLSIDSNIFDKAITNNLDNLKALFIGTSDNKGLGTLLKTYTDSWDDSKGLLTQYNTNMTSRKEKLDAELLKEKKLLDDKYKQMVSDFASYGSIISTMEAQFSSLKMMIQQSIASK